MDKNRIIKVIKNALSQGVAPSSPTEIFHPESFIAYKARYHVETKPEVLDTVVEGLKREKDLAVFDGGFMNRGAIFESPGGSWVEFRDLAEWLLAGAIAESAEKAVEHLDRFIKSEATPAIEVLALNGVKTEEPMELADNVSLVPISKLPRSHHTDCVQGIPQWRYSHLSLSTYPDQALATAAIVIKRSIPKFLTNELEGDTSTPLSDRKIGKIGRCLTLLGPSAPTPISHWFQLEEWVPLAFKSSSASVMIHEIQQDTRFPGNTLTIHKAGSKELISKFLSLKNEVRTKLKVPIDRLNLSIKRRDNVDKAIELGIALESLLMRDRDSDAPISYLLRLRGAFLGGETLAERLGVKKTLNSAYELRSQAVHSGVFKKNKENPDDTLKEVTEVCTKLIRRIIEDGSFPDWEKLILNPPKLDQ